MNHLPATPAEWLDRLYNLRRDKSGDHERPHKPVLLLAIFDLMDRGVIGANQVPLSDELVAAFKRIFEVVRRANDKPNIELPFFHLSGDKIWKLVPKPGEAELYREGFVGKPPSTRQLRELCLGGRFDPDLWELISDPVARHQIREALISRYFPWGREELAALAAAAGAASQEAVLRQEPPPYRAGAFRRVVLEIYDFRCAACGLRVPLEWPTALVDAAHLVPFEESRDDRPNNGMALCPNHHRAMDRRLIAPCPDPDHPAGVWRINTRLLDARIDGQKEMAALTGQRVIPPRDKRFFPDPDSLKWRCRQLSRSA